MTAVKNKLCYKYFGNTPQNHGVYFIKNETSGYINVLSLKKEAVISLLLLL